MTTEISEAPKHSKSRPIQLPQESPYELGLKRVFDVLCVLLALPFIAPLIAIMVLMVWTDGGPAFYRQDRVGRNGRVYQIWKMRTMVPKADKMLKQHLASNAVAADEWALTQKLKDDPRITRVGRMLRKSSLDELPQLWNVLIGEMSLVGPRPMLPEQVALYPGRAYYSQRPGITGEWQVSERNETSFAARAMFDKKYVANISFANDVKILLATVRVVLKGTGY